MQKQFSVRRAVIGTGYLINWGKGHRHLQEEMMVRIQVLTISLFILSWSRNWRCLRWNILHGQVLWTECLCLPQVYMLKSYPQSDAIRGRVFRRELSHDGEALMSGISVLLKESPENPLSPPSVWIQWEDDPLWTRKHTLITHRICWCLDFELLNPQNCEK